MEDVVLDKKIDIIYCTCNTHPEEIDTLCRESLQNVRHKIVSVSLNKEIDFGDKRIVIRGEKGPLMLFKQLVLGLEASTADFVFFAESDMIYHPSHFEFVPERDDVYYFNVNVWKMRWSDRLCVRVDNSQQLSGCVASRKLLLDYYKNKVRETEKNGFDRHFEPRGVTRVNFESEQPNICIRHGNNMSVTRWSPKDYRNKEYARGWKESYEVPGWNINDLILRQRTIHKS